jgi:hypothetical protein
MRWFVAILLSVHATYGMYVCCSHSPVADERTRLSAGCAHWSQGDFQQNPGNPPLNDLIAAAPFVFSAQPEGSPALTGLSIYSADVVGCSVLGRLALMPFSVMGGFVCFEWTARLFGRWPGMAVLALWCFDPLILAHGTLITGDMAATATGIVAGYTFAMWLRSPGLLNALVCGMALGLALLTKYVWVVMPVLWAVLWAVRRFVSPRPKRWPLPGHLAVMAVLAVYVVNVGYAFESTFQPWRTFQFDSPTLQRLAFDPEATSGLSAWLGAVPVPLPRNYIMGIDSVASHVETTDRATYVNGEFHDSSVWWFYVYGLLVKTPLGTWLLLVIAVYARVTSGGSRVESSESRVRVPGAGRREPLTLALSPDRGRSEVGKPVVGGEGTTAVPAALDRGESGDATGHSTALEVCRTEVAAMASQSRRADDDATVRNDSSTKLFGARHRFTDLVLWLPAITILVFVSWVTQIKMLRYILPMLPFVFIWIGHAFVWAQEGRWWRMSLVYGALAWSVSSSLWVYPHSLSYFNEAAGGTANGHAHLIGASYDWGQDLLFLKDWADKHPDAQPLYVACYNAFEPLQAEIETDVLPTHGPIPGWYAISASVLRGGWTRQFLGHVQHKGEYAYLESFFDQEPVDRVAYSIFIYHLDCDQANAMRAKLGLELLECGE